MGLDVPMDDPVAVREAQRGEDLTGVGDRVRRPQAPARPDQLLEVATLDHLHRDVVRPFGFAAVVDRDDVRVRECRGRLGLAAEPLHEELVGRVAVVQDLDRDPPAELVVFREVDVGHSARAEAPDDAVATVEDGIDEGVRDVRHPSLKAT